MSIFSEVGKLIVDEAEKESNNASHYLEKESAYPLSSGLAEEVSPDEGELVMDGPDTLRVAVINRVLSTGKPGPLASKQEMPDMQGLPFPADAEDGSAKSTGIASGGIGEITGNVVFPESAAVSAHIHGNVSAKGKLSLCGVVDGNVEAEDVILCGIIRGSLNCRHLILRKVEGGSVSRVDGFLSLKSLSVD